MGSQSKPVVAAARPTTFNPTDIAAATFHRETPCGAFACGGAASRGPKKFRPSGRSFMLSTSYFEPFLKIGFHRTAPTRLPRRGRLSHKTDRHRFSRTTASCFGPSICAGLRLLMTLLGRRPKPFIPCFLASNVSWGLRRLAERELRLFKFEIFDYLALYISPHFISILVSSSKNFGRKLFAPLDRPFPRTMVIGM